MRYFKIDMEQHMIELPDDVSRGELDWIGSRIQEAINFTLADKTKYILGAACLAGGIGLVEVNGETGQVIEEVKEG